MPGAAHRLVTIACLTTLLAACKEAPAAKVVGTRAVPAAERAAAPSPAPSPTPSPVTFPTTLRPIACRAAPARSAHALVDATGGSVSVAGATVVLPPGAVSSLADVTVTVTAAPALELRIQVEGPDSARFEQPALVTLDYSGCRSSAARGTPLGAWRMDDAGERLVERMDGEDDRELRLITFVTSSASRYAIAR